LSSVKEPFVEREDLREDGNWGKVGVASFESIEVDVSLDSDGQAKA